MMNQPTPATNVAARVYFHLDCGNTTEIGGYQFERLANPFCLVTSTFCSGCGKAVPLNTVEWSDTQENVATYRHRLRNEPPPGQRVVRLVVAPVFGALLGLTLGWMVFFFKPSGIPAALFGAGIGAFLGVQFLVPVLFRWLWNLDYRTRRDR
jgi:hypothetical protein